MNIEKELAALQRLTVGQLKARYADPEGLKKQEMILKVMERIVTQTIPAIVIDNPRVDWNPVTNAVSVAPADEVEADAPARPASADPTREDDVRYRKLLANFHAARREDPFVPVAPTAIARSFEARELPEERVRALLPPLGVPSKVTLSIPFSPARRISVALKHFSFISTTTGLP